MRKRLESGFCIDDLATILGGCNVRGKAARVEKVLENVAVVLAKRGNFPEARP